MDMIQGVNLLNVIHHEVSGWGLNASVIILAICGVIGLASFIIGGIIRNSDLLGIVGIIVMLIGLVGSISTASLAGVKQTYDTYEISLDNSVNMKEFANKYTIVGQRGNIYEVRIKDIENSYTVKRE